MLGAGSAEYSRAGDNRDGQLVRLAAVHEPPFGQLVEYLVACDEHEIRERDVDYRDRAADGGAAGRADHERLHDAGVANSVASELVNQPARQAELAAHRRQVLSHGEHSLVARHLQLDRETDALLVAQLLARLGPVHRCRHETSLLRVEVFEDHVPIRERPGESLLRCVSKLGSGGGLDGAGRRIIHVAL